MSELKATTAYKLTLNTEDSDVIIHNDDFLCGGDCVDVYDKSEADKVIADLEESHRMEVEQLLILNREQANAANRLRDSMEQAIRHQKYKRCLAMARWCNANYFRQYMFKPKFWKRWCYRWLELADKFKEG